MPAPLLRLVLRSRRLNAFCAAVRGNRGGGTAVFLCFRRRHAFRRRRLFWFRLCGCFGRRTSGCGCFIGKGRSFAVRGTAVRTVRPARGLFVFRCAGVPAGAFAQARCPGCRWRRRTVPVFPALWRTPRGPCSYPHRIRLRAYRAVHPAPPHAPYLRRRFRRRSPLFRTPPSWRQARRHSRGRAARKGERHGERVALYADLQPAAEILLKDCAMESPRPLPSVVRLASPRTKRWSTSSGAKFIS